MKLLLATCLLLALSHGAGWAEGGREVLTARLRLAVDGCSMASILSRNPDLARLHILSIVPDGEREIRTGAETWRCDVGEIKVLDPADLRVTRRTELYVAFGEWRHPAAVDPGRLGGYSGAVSGYGVWHGGGMPEFDEMMASPHFLIPPKGWLPEIAEIAAGKPAYVITNSDSPMGLVMLAVTLPKSASAAMWMSLIEAGDVYSRGSIVYHALSRSAPLAAALVGKLKQDPSQHWVDGVMAGAISACTPGAPRDRIDPLLEALLAHCERHPDAPDSAAASELLRVLLGKR